MDKLLGPVTVDGGTGDLMSLAEFNDMVHCGGITDDDGYGYQVSGGPPFRVLDRVPFYPSMHALAREDATHILWFNK